MKKCASIKSDGQRCQRIVPASQTYCYSHDETCASERKSNASLAGKSKPSVELREVKRELRRLAEDVRSGEIDRGTGAVLASVYGVLIRACAEARKTRELEELAREVSEMRSILNERSA